MILETNPKCPHFQALNITHTNIPVQLPFLKPSITQGWLCLYDGCLKKTLTQKQLIEQAKKLEDKHKIFINTATLAIFCTLCEQQLTDDEYGEIIRMIRELAIESDPEQQKTLFAGNMEYPPSFQREKSGICGTVGDEINGYVGSILQLFAHTPVLYHIALEYNLQEKRGSRFLHKFFEKIVNIRSGKYRILKIYDFEKAILESNKQFSHYQHKNPSALQYQILRHFSDQLMYEGPQCHPHQVISPKTENSPHHFKYQSMYSPMKALFSGYFKWIGNCEVCSHQRIIKSQFECIRLQCNEKAMEIKEYVELEDLIRSTFDLFSPQNNPFNLENRHKPCQKCKKQNSDNEHFYLVNKEACLIELPNLLLLEFGNTSQGLRINLPEYVDLTPYVKKSGEQSPTQKQFEYEYVGSVGIWKKKYVTHVREQRQLSGQIRNFLFNQAIVKEDGKIERILDNKLAIYKLKPIIKNKNIAKNIMSSIQVQIKCTIPLPDFWFHYLQHLRKIQPLIHPLICIHGYFKPRVTTKSSIVRKIPPQIYEYLVEEFGGLKILVLEDAQKCKKCCNRMELLEEIRKSEKEMAKFADSLSNKKSKFCIDKDWLQKWKKYLYEQCRNSYSMQGYRRPGMINNRRGVKEQLGSIDDSKYKKVSPEVWYFFKKFYGGGPLITTQKTDPKLAVVQAIDLRYEAIKHKIEQFTAKQ